MKYFISIALFLFTATTAFAQFSDDFSDGDYVAVESYSDGKLQDGRVYNNRYSWVFKMNGNKIGYLHEYMDSHYVATLFGL